MLLILFSAEVIPLINHSYLFTGSEKGNLAQQQDLLVFQISFQSETMLVNFREVT